MKNNILGGLVIFMVVVTCLLMIDDISSPTKEPTDYTTTEVEEQVAKPNDLAIVENED